MKKNGKKIVTRFPPSPTGHLHIGNIRTLLFNYLFARHNGGRIVMRFEDTDRERSEKKYEDSALETLTALGLGFDEGPYRQSERGVEYEKAIEYLLEKDAAYAGEESEDGSGEKVIRFRNPNKEITFVDAIRGEITIDATDFGDFVIARSKTNPLYHLTVVVDDIDMNITHVIRGEDHITSTPRQMLLIEALDGAVPTYAHLPLIIGEDKKKLGKRQGAITYQEFERRGYLPEALLNYLALLGWNPGDEREIFSMDELVKEFTLERVNNSPATFSYEKLDSINKQYLDALDDEAYTARAQEFIPKSVRGEFLAANFKTFVRVVLRERLSKFAELTTDIENGEFDWLIKVPEYTAEKLSWKDTPQEVTATHLKSIKQKVEEGSAGENLIHDELKKLIFPYAESEGKGEALWPLRFALSGKEKSPDPFSLMEVLGKEETIKRINHAIVQLG